MKENLDNATNPALRLLQRTRPVVASAVSSTDSQSVTKDDTLASNTESKTESKTVKHPAKPKKSLLQKQDKKEVKSLMMTVRTTSDVKDDFDAVRKFYGYSQSAFLAVLVAMAKQQAVEDGWEQ